MKQESKNNHEQLMNVIRKAVIYLESQESDADEMKPPS